MNPTYDMLIPTIPHRHASLMALLECLDQQRHPDFRVRLLRDNLQRPGIASYAKWQDLADSSTADYISWAGDDDLVAPDFTEQIMGALAQWPDYVGFPVRFTASGVQQARVEHTLRHGGWFTSRGMYCRDICHHNPIRRELALLGQWGTWAAPNEDELWASVLRDSGRVKTEVWIEQEMYYYQQGETFWGAAKKAPMAEADIPPLPSYPWLTVL